LVADGTPEAVAKTRGSHTGRFLAPHLAALRKPKPAVTAPRVKSSAKSQQAARLTKGRKKRASRNEEVLG